MTYLKSLITLIVLRLLTTSNFYSQMAKKCHCVSKNAVLNRNLTWTENSIKNQEGPESSFRNKKKLQLRKRQSSSIFTWDM